MLCTLIAIIVDNFSIKIFAMVRMPVLVFNTSCVENKEKGQGLKIWFRKGTYIIVEAIGCWKFLA